MHVLHEPNDPLMQETLQYLATNAVESSQANQRVQIDTITLSCTANTLQGQTVTFAKPYAKSTAPVLFLFANPSTTSSKVTTSHDKTKLTNASFQVQVYSDTTQSVDVSYIAIGQTGGA